MGRNLKAKGTIARRLNFAVYEKQQRILTKRGTPPGVHGAKGYPRLTEYGKQLQEKQKAKFIYGLMERQFRKYFEDAKRRKGDTGELLFRLLETRLDNVLYRAGLCKTREQARQLVNHAHVLVNEKRVDIPSYQVKVGDIITIKERSKKMKLLVEAQEKLKSIETVSWLVTDGEKLLVKITDLPKVTDMTGEFNPKMITEFYSR